MLQFVLLQAGGSGSGMSFFIMMGLMAVVFYFFMIRPQQKKAKDQKNFKEAMKKGDYVVTIGGMHGRILSLESDDTIIIEVDKGYKLKFEKSSISAEVTKKYQDLDKTNS